jgi:hypothetical protein
MCVKIQAAKELKAHDEPITKNVKMFLENRDIPI